MPACKDCRFLIVDKNHVVDNFRYKCGASPRREVFDAYSGEMKIPDPPYYYCWLINDGNCKKFEKKGE